MANFMENIDGKVSGNKAFSKEKITLVMLIAAAAIFTISFISDVGSDWLYATASILWSAAFAFCVIFGVLMKKENFLTLGILLDCPFVISAFANCFNMLGNIDFSFSVWYGLYAIMAALGYVGVAGGFVLWALDKFLGIKTPSGLITLLAVAAVAFFSLAFIFDFIFSIVVDFSISFFLYPLYLVASTLFYFCEYIRER